MATQLFSDIDALKKSFVPFFLCLSAALLPLVQNGMYLSARTDVGCPTIGHFFS